jgi:hypothetical protein
MESHMDMPGHGPMDMGEMDMQGAGGANETPQSHHMVVIGHDTLYMSHLPMFSMAEHAYQVIVETELAGHGDPLKVYQDDREQHPEVPFYTFAPEPFVLSEILSTDGHPAARKSFKGDLFRNHLEKRDPPHAKIAVGVTVNVKNIVLGRRLDADAPEQTELQYILFGRGDDVFLAHVLTRPPDFDQLIQVAAPPEVSADELRLGVPVTVAGRKNLLGDRVTPSDKAVAATVTTTHGSVSVKIEPIVEVYENHDSDMGGE